MTLSFPGHRAALIAGLSLCLAGPALAQTSPQNPVPRPPTPEECAAVFDGQRITLVVSNEAGGGYDLYARALAPVLSELSGASALVSNLPGGGGKAAIVRVTTAASSEMVVLFDSANDTLSALLTDPSLNASLADLSVLGVVHSEGEVWLARSDLDLTDPATTSVVSGSTMIESNLIPVGLTASTLGLQASLVAGYGSSSENVEAILRGEVDMTSVSATTARRALDSSDAESGALKVVLSLSDAPNPAHPDAPWLGGAGGLVDQRSTTLPKEERAQRQDLARTVIALTNNLRTVFAPAGMDPAPKACLASVVAAALTSDAFKDGAAAVKRPITPMIGTEAEAAVNAIDTAYRSARPLLEAMLEKQGG